MSDEVIGKDDTIKGNTASIETFTSTILILIGKYAENEPIDIMDLFLGIHNVHKLVIVDLAARMASDSFPEEKLYRLADMMFREAMRDLKRALPVRSVQADDARLRMDPLGSKKVQSVVEAEVAAWKHQTEPSE